MLFNRLDTSGLDLQHLTSYTITQITRVIVLTYVLCVFGPDYIFVSSPSEDSTSITSLWMYLNPVVLIIFAQSTMGAYITGKAECFPRVARFPLSYALYRRTNVLGVLWYARRFYLLSR